jgi:NADPH:quinone reductase-like Zn-dependent oxidoreductase
MKAVYIERFGGPEVLQFGDLPDPVAAPGEAVIDIHAASFNAADWKVRLGQYKQTKFPLGLGRDFSGVVSAIGGGVVDLRPGDAVFGVLEAGQEGAHAEKIGAKASILARKPDDLSHVAAAAVALTGLTAISAIEDTLKLRAGERILIQGGAGGVASIAIQLAKYIGAHVITTTSAANFDYVSMCAVSEPMKSSTTTLAILLKVWPIAMPCSIRSAATWRRGPSQCSSRAAARRLSLLARRRQSPHATM